MQKTLFFIALISLVACEYDNEEDLFANEEMTQLPTASDTTSSDSTNRPTPVSYSKDVLPIITNSCNGGSCHGQGASPGKGNYFVYSQIKLRVDNGRFDAKVLNVQTRDMPKNRPPLPQNQIDLLKRWISEGAPNN